MIRFLVDMEIMLKNSQVFNLQTLTLQLEIWDAICFYIYKKRILKDFYRENLHLLPNLLSNPYNEPHS